MAPTASPFRILGIAGSLRAASYNGGLLRAARELAPAGMAIEIFGGLREIPLYDADVEARGEPEPVTRFKRAIADADGLLIATPEYNYGMSGVLKNAIDWASRPPAKSPLIDKPTAIMGASQGATGTARAQMALRNSFVFTRTLVMVAPEVLVARAQEKFAAEGRLTDETTRKFVRNLLDAFQQWIGRVRITG